MAGWVKLHRSIWAWRYSPLATGEVFSKMEAWLDLICLASHADHLVGNVFVERGQVLTSQVKLAHRWKWSRNKVRRFLDCLESGSEIVQQTIQQAYTLISLLNYGIYQANGTADDTANGTPNDTADGQPTEHTQEGKKERMKESLVGTESFRLAELLYSLILRNNPKAKKPNLEKWAQTVDRMMRLDERDPQEIEVLIRWCQDDDFWYSNILSTEKLRKQYDQLCMKMMKKPAAGGCKLSYPHNRRGYLDVQLEQCGCPDCLKALERREK